MVGPELFIERESLPSLEDLKALIEAEEDLKKDRVMPLSKIEEELR
ncbi:hypothetical protein J7L36_00645 [bacterium]|nr:hypothetical protein [bacterium]